MRLKKEFLCANSVILCVSVVILGEKTVTTEARRSHRGPQRIRTRPTHTCCSRLARSSLGVAILIFAAQVCFSQNAPQVLKVEPPGWWSSHSIDPVRVLFRGKNLSGARVQADSGLIAGPAKINQTGTYLFVNVTMARALNSGRHVLKITTPRGSVE